MLETLFPEIKNQKRIATSLSYITGDMYYEAYCTHGFEHVANEKIRHNEDYFGSPKGMGIMMNNGNACANDIEMLLFAFSENTWQYFVPYGRSQKISRAIKSSVQYIFDGRTSQKFIWNSLLYYFELL